jgi:hypothetical protein
MFIMSKAMYEYTKSILEREVLIRCFFKELEKQSKLYSLRNGTVARVVTKSQLKDQKTMFVKKIKKKEPFIGSFLFVW